MAGIIENFKLDMADDHGIDFAHCGLVVGTIVSLQKEMNFKTARQTIVNAFADLIETDYAEAERLFLDAHARRDELVEAIKQSRSDRTTRGLQNAISRFQRQFAC